MLKRLPKDYDKKVDHIPGRSQVGVSVGYEAKSQDLEYGLCEIDEGKE